MKWTVGTKIATGFGAVLLTLLVVGMLSYRGTTGLIEATYRSRAAFESLDALSGTRYLLRGVGLAVRSFLLTGEERDMEALRVAQRGVEQALRELQTHVGGDPVQVQRLGEVSALLKEYLATVANMANLRRTQGLSAAVAAFASDDSRRLLDAMGSQLAALQKDLEAAVDQRVKQVQDEAKFARAMLIAGSAVALIIATLAGWIITRNLATPLRSLTFCAERVTRGDLSSTVDVGPRGDEIGVLAQALQRMTQSLRDAARTAELIAKGDLRTTVQAQSADDVLGTVFARMSTDLRTQARGMVEAVAVLSAAASEIVASSSQLAASASQSAAAVSETTSTVEEVRHTAQLASQKARVVSDTSQRAQQVANDGRRSTQDVETGMTRIRSQMDNIAAGMMRLSERNQAVGQVIAAVEDLATQSNMLAVNAAIEAAKAGDHGKGFSVVAQEVKNLAEQSRQATHQVRAILGDIQKATAAAVMATEEGAKVVDAGARQAESAGNSVQSLGISVDEAAQAALQIAASSQQQLVGMDQVAGAMDSIMQASTQNVASASQLEATARNIDELGQRLKQMVDNYKV